MAKTFRPTSTSRLANRIPTRLLRAGRGPGFMRLLTVVGRRSERGDTTPVVPVVTAQGRWLGVRRTARSTGSATRVPREPWSSAEAEPRTKP